MNFKSCNWIESSKLIHFSGYQYIGQFKLNMESLNKQLWCVIITWTASFLSQIKDKNMNTTVLFFPFPCSFPSSFLTWAVMTQGPFLSTWGKQSNWFPSSQMILILYPKLLNLKKTLSSTINHSNLKCSSTRKQNNFSDDTRIPISAWKFFFPFRGRGKNKPSVDSSLSHRGSKVFSVKVIFHFLLWFTTQLIKMWGLILVLGSLWSCY